MCLTIPGQIKKINGQIAVIDQKIKKQKVNVSLISKPRIGDWVLVLNGFAVQKIEAEQAQSILGLL